MDMISLMVSHVVLEAGGMSSWAIPFISILFLLVLELQGLGQEQLGHVSRLTGHL